MTKRPSRRPDGTLSPRAMALLAELNYWETRYGGAPTRKPKGYKIPGEARAKIDSLVAQLAEMNVSVVRAGKVSRLDDKRRKDLVARIKRDGPLTMSDDELKKKDCCELVSFNADDPGYNDNGESHKKIKFKFKVKAGSDPKKCILVQWCKGSFKQGNGKPFTATHQDKNTPIDFSDWTIDTVDTDPAYWSKDGSRWNYDSEGDDTYSATDDPGPATSSEHGAVYAMKFKMCIYCIDEVPEKKVNGTITAKAIKCIEWQYSVKVANDGAFTHPDL
jgi:hypothetical protein